MRFRTAQILFVLSFAAVLLHAGGLFARAFNSPRDNALRFFEGLPPGEVREVHGDGSIAGVSIENTKTGEVEQVECDALITLLGFHSHLGAIAEWGVELHGKRQLLVDATSMETSIPGIYAAGDVAGYEGKITLITIGFGEAAIAANNAVAKIRGEKVQPKYSTD